MSYALVVCNGEPPAPRHLADRASGASLVVAADGGIVPLTSEGIVPDVLIGDLDSSLAPYPDGVNVILDPDQETNDLEKALNYVYANAVQDVIVLGATGLRIDQTLKNMSVLVQFHEKFRNIRFEDTLCQIFVAGNNTELSLPVGTAISLFPISGKVDEIVTQGLMYALHNESLEIGVRDGSSNVVVSNPVSIQYRTGTLILIVNHTTYPASWF